MKKFDIVNKPQHYNAGDIEVITYIKDKLPLQAYEGFLMGNVIKYTSRYKLKNGVEDLKKAKWYLNKTIELLEEAK